MIFFGTRRKALPRRTMDGDACKHCQTGQYNTFGMFRYFHIYWIPMFVTSKKAGMECTHCKQTRMDQELPERLRATVLSEVFETNRAWPYSLGLILLGIAFALPFALGILAALVDLV